MKTASAAQIAAHFHDYLEASRRQPVLVTRNGKPVAVLVAVQDKAEAEQLAVGRLRSLRSIFAEAHEQIEKGGGFPMSSSGSRSSNPDAPSALHPRGARSDPIDPESVDPRCSVFGKE